MILNQRPTVRIGGVTNRRKRTGRCPDRTGPRSRTASRTTEAPHRLPRQPESEPEIDVEEGPVHRPLIRATLPRPEGQPPPTRPAPEFTIRQPSWASRPIPAAQSSRICPFSGEPFRATTTWLGVGNVTAGWRTAACVALRPAPWLGPEALEMKPCNLPSESSNSYSPDA